MVECSSFRSRSGAAVPNENQGMEAPPLEFILHKLLKSMYQNVEIL
jgi:hypothetical protein